jgi:hypothetical protein
MQAWVDERYVATIADFLESKGIPTESLAQIVIDTFELFCTRIVEEGGRFVSDEAEVNRRIADIGLARFRAPQRKTGIRKSMAETLSTHAAREQGPNIPEDHKQIILRVQERLIKDREDREALAALADATKAGIKEDTNDSKS